jgi:hypothetical protein
MLSHKRKSKGLIEGDAKFLHLKSSMQKEFEAPDFCMGWTSNYVDSESHSESSKILQYLVSNKILPLPHLVHINLVTGGNAELETMPLNTP